MQAALADRPTEEPLWPAVIEAVVHGFATEAEDLRQARRITPTPTLAAEQLKAIMVIEQGLAEGIARRIGADVGRDLYPRLVAAAVISCPSRRSCATPWSAWPPAFPWLRNGGPDERGRGRGGRRRWPGRAAAGQ
jgi:hypothetical protein